MPDHRPIKYQHALLVTDIPHRRLTCLIGDPLETWACFIMVTHLQLTCPIRDPSETDLPHQRSTCLWVSDEAFWGLWWVSNGPPIRHVIRWWFSDQTYWSPMGLWWSMSVSDEACWGLRWVSYQACQSLMKHVVVSDGSLIRHVVLPWVSDGSPIGLWWESDNNNISVFFIFYLVGKSTFKTIQTKTIHYFDKLTKIFLFSKL